MKRLAWFALCAALLCPGILLQAEEEQHLPGKEKTGKTKALEAGAELLQSKGPLRAIHGHVCGFHFYNGDLKRQVRADHYCSHLGEEMLQCVIYDSDKEGARLIGIEYIISEALFKSLPEEEKQLWHSHRHEVMSGQLVAPGLPTPAENELMKKLVNTYGKTWHTWQVDRDSLPLGLPKLMMGFTADGQANPELVRKRDAELGIDSAKIQAQRAKELHPAEVAPGADAWQHGKVFQLSDELLKAPVAPGGNP